MKISKRFIIEFAINIVIWSAANLIINEDPLNWKTLVGVLIQATIFTFLFSSVSNRKEVKSPFTLKTLKYIIIGSLVLTCLFGTVAFFLRSISSPYTFAIFMAAFFTLVVFLYSLAQGFLLKPWNNNSEA